MLSYLLTYLVHAHAEGHRRDDHADLPAHEVRVHLCVCMCVCVYVCMCMYIWMDGCMDAYTYVHVTTRGSARA